MDDRTEMIIYIIVIYFCLLVMMIACKLITEYYVRLEMQEENYTSF